MCDRPAVRAFTPGSFHVDVDPLPVARRLGEQVDHLLRDRYPLARPQGAAHRGQHLILVGKDFHISLSLSGNLRSQNQIQAVVAQELPALRVTQTCRTVEEVGRFAQAFRVRPVGAHDEGLHAT